MLKAIVIDDERLARAELISMLQEHGGISVIGEADGVNGAVELIKEKDPDVIFLDIQMPGGSGFDLVEKIDQRFRIVFVTAFDEYAIKAFEINALDYLLKPVDPERLNMSIKRLEENFKNVKGAGRYSYDDVIFITFNSNKKFLKISNIQAITSAGDYTEVKTIDGSKGITDKSMKEWEARLPENSFSRIHRSTIVNIEQVEKLEEWINKTYKVFLRGLVKPFIMSRRYAYRIKNILK